MSLTTSCPACGTLFRVVPDQLRISDGWVRCGKCAGVFDAQAQMQGMPAPAAPNEAQAPSNAIPTDPPPPAEAELPLAERLAVMAAEIAQETADAEAEEAERARRRASFKTLAAEEVVPPSTAVRSRAGKPRDPAARHPEMSTPVSAPAFVQQAERRAFWRQGWVVAGLRLVCLLLLAALGWQAVVHERDRLAAMWPGLQPVLVSLCRPRNCAIAPLRRIDEVVIDSSNFTRLQVADFRLSVVLKSTAALPLAVPAVEVTLTDARGEPVVRRVIAADVLSPGSAVLQAGGELPRTLALTLIDEAQGSRVTGYRVLAFYP